MTHSRHGRRFERRLRRGVLLLQLGYELRRNESVALHALHVLTGRDDGGSWRKTREGGARARQSSADMVVTSTRRQVRSDGHLQGFGLRCMT